jgi:hypothetical protein
MLNFLRMKVTRILGANNILEVEAALQGQLIKFILNLLSLIVVIVYKTRNFPGIDGNPPLLIPAGSFVLYFHSDGSNNDVSALHI